MKLFLDTEFTGLSRPMLERKLIPLALVGEDRSCYLVCRSRKDTLWAGCRPGK